MATVVDVVRRAGVSVATVSHGLNRTRFVKELTRRVLQAAEALNDQPNVFAPSASMRSCCPA